MEDVLSAVSMVYLDRLVDDAVDNSQRVEIKLNTINSTIGDSLILLIEIIEELRSLDLHFFFFFF